MAGTNQLLVGQAGGGTSVTTGTFISLGGLSGGSTTEANWKVISETAFTFSHLAYLDPGFNIGTNTFVFRHNGANGNNVCTLTGLGTVWVVDSTHTDSIAIGDTTNAEFTTTSLLNANGVFQGQANNTTPFTEFSSEVTGSVAASGFASILGGGATTATESIVVTPVRAAGTASGLCTSWTASGTTLTIRWRNGGVNGNQSVAQTSSGAVVDSTHTDSVASGDLVNYSHTFTGGSVTPFTNSVGFAGKSSKQDIGIGGSATGTLTASTTYFTSLGGNVGVLSTLVTTETFVLRTLPYALTGSNLRINVNANSAATPVIHARDNSANVNQTVSVASGATGVLEDTTHTDSYASGDKLSASVVLGTFTTFGFTSVMMSVDDGTDDAVQIPLTAVSATGSVGSVGPAFSLALGGVTATGSVGSLTVGLNAALLGAVATGSVGQLAPAITVPLTGVTATGSVGSLSLLNLVTLGPVSAVGSVGSLKPSLTIVLGGVSGLGSVGTLTPHGVNDDTPLYAGLVFMQSDPVASLGPLTATMFAAVTMLEDPVSNLVFLSKTPVSVRTGLDQTPITVAANFLN